MKILLTGGTGFVGQVVLRELLQRGHQVIATTRRFHNNLPGDRNLQWVSWDGTKQALPMVNWPEFRAIVHLAAVTNSTSAPENATEIYELSVAAAFRLLQAARVNGVPRLLMASTGDVLGPMPLGAREHDVNYAPTSFYGAAKACAELLVRSYRDLLSTAILRFYHPFGPGGDRFLVNRLVHRVAQGEAIKIEGQDGIRLNPVWIDDLAVGVRQAVESDQSGIFHFGGPETLSLRDLVVTIGKLVGREPMIESIAGPCVQRHVGLFDWTSQVLGYRPRVSIEEGLIKMLALQKEARNQAA
jgi:nucleoside-diphosphate-sugar epimerase